MKKTTIIFITVIILILCMAVAINADTRLVPIQTPTSELNKDILAGSEDDTNGTEDEEDSSDSTSNNQNIFMRLEGFYLTKDESDLTRPGEIKLVSFNLGTTQASGSIKVVKHLDSCSTRLMLSSIQGTHHRSNTITIYKDAAANEILATIKLYDIQIKSSNMVIDNGNPTEALEELVLTFAKMEITQNVYKADGSFSHAVKLNYDFNTKRTY